MGFWRFVLGKDIVGSEEELEKPTNGQQILTNYLKTTNQILSEVSAKNLENNLQDVAQLNTSLAHGKGSSPFPTTAILNGAKHYVETSTNQKGKELMQKFIDHTESALKEADDEFERSLSERRQTW